MHEPNLTLQAVWGCNVMNFFILITFQFLYIRKNKILILNYELIRREIQWFK
jgi:hypothetical protein